MQAVMVAAFGIVGVLCRYFVDTWVTRQFSLIPYGTLVINVLGSFLAGVIYGIGVNRIPPHLRVSIMIGLLGGFTTFSSYALQSARILETGHWGPGVAYLLGSPILGLGAAFLGLALSRAVFQ